MLHNRIIVDAAGGIVLQLGGWWAHRYTTPDDYISCAMEIMEWNYSLNTEQWDGHDPVAQALKPTRREISEGKYRVLLLGAGEIYVPLLIVEQRQLGWSHTTALANELEVRTSSQVT